VVAGTVIGVLAVVGVFAVVGVLAVVARVYFTLQGGRKRLRRTRVPNLSPTGARRVPQQQSQRTQDTPQPQSMSTSSTSDGQRTRMSDMEDADVVMSPIKGVRQSASMPLLDAAKHTCVAGSDADGFLAAERGAALAATDPHGLTADEAGALMLYTMEGTFYQRLNTLLRGRERQALMPFFPYLKLMLQARDKIPPFAGTVFRGVHGVDLTPKFPEGKEFYWWAFTSTTKRLNVLENPQFLGKSGLRTIFMIQVQSGVDVSPYSIYGEEVEVLLYPGTKLKVNSTLDVGNGLVQVHLEEVHVPVHLFQ